MKFAKYLESESIPEWRKAYINYKGLKRRLKYVDKFRKNSEHKAAIELDDAFDVDNHDDDYFWCYPSTWKFYKPTTLTLLKKWSTKDATLERLPSRPVSYRSTMTLSVWDEVLLHANESERTFFDTLNHELDKVSLFYNEKENEAKAKFESLKIQIKLIAEYGRHLLELGPNLLTPPYPSLFPSRHSRLPNVPNFVGHATDPHISYSVARNRLKKALTEFYRSLEFLKSYKTLNETGFQKILKKFDKVAGWKASGLYNQKIKKYKWIQSTLLDDIIDETELLYINEFADGHRRRGMAKLRVPEKNENYNATTWRIGLYLGISLSFLTQAIKLGFEPKTAHQLPNIYTNIQIYACFLLPILFCLGFSLNLLIWHKYRINYKFIFELDPRHNLDYHQFAELPSFMLLVSSMIIYIDFSQWFENSIPSELYPMILFVVLLAMILCPFDIMYFSARKWLAVALGRILLSYCFPVEFRDFFIADELNSLAYSFWTVSYFFCAYKWHWNDMEAHCSMKYSWLSSILAVLPPWWRLLQCIRRYQDSDEKIHLVNACKYMSGIVTTFAGGLRKIHGGTWTFYLWIILAIINSCYTSTWDLKMDWGLVRPNSRYFLLRDELVFHRTTYYIAMPVNILLRFSWVVTLIDTPIHSDVLAFIIAFFEALRRIQWNTFRLENEHLNNCGQFRAIKEIPLPFAMVDDQVDDESTMNQSRPGSHHLSRPNSSVVAINDDFIEQGYPSINIYGSENININNNNDNMSHHLMNGYFSPSSPIPMATGSLSKRHSYHDGSFYGRRDFENKHDREEAEFVASTSFDHSPRRYFSAHSTPLDNVMTHIRSISGAYTDVSDTEHEDDEIDSDDDS
ncbi:unnamed protein product [Cunninghamella blakesleeana]